MKPSYLIILLLMNFFWAAVYSAYKVLGPDLHTGGIVTLRFGLAALPLLFAWPWLPGPAPKGRDLAKTCLMGILGFVIGQRLQVYGNQAGSAGNSSVLMAGEPIVTSVAAALFLGEHIGPRRLAGFAVALLGVAVLNRAWSTEFQWIGFEASLIFVSSFLCEAAYSVIGKPIVAQASVMKMLAISLAVGTAANLLIDGPTTFATAKVLSPKAWFLLSFMAVVCTAIGYSAWFIVIRDCPVNVAALTIFAQAVFGVAIAHGWLGERLHWGHIMGSLTIVAGLALGLSRQINKTGCQPDPGQ
jgi:drug/metabolite transporter (DMT)-like permease